MSNGEGYFPRLAGNQLNTVANDAIKENQTAPDRNGAIKENIWEEPGMSFCSQEMSASNEKDGTSETEVKRRRLGEDEVKTEDEEALDAENVRATGSDVQVPPDFEIGPISPEEGATIGHDVQRRLKKETSAPKMEDEPDMNSFCMPCISEEDVETMRSQNGITDDVDWEPRISSTMGELVKLHLCSDSINEVLVVLELRCNLHLGKRPFRVGERIHVVNPQDGSWLSFAATYEGSTVRGIINVRWEDDTMGEIPAELAFPALIEQPARLQWIADRIALTDLRSNLTFISGRKALDEEMEYEYDLESIKEMDELEEFAEHFEGWGCVDKLDFECRNAGIECTANDTTVGPGSFQGIRYSVGGLLEVMNRVREKFEKTLQSPDEVGSKHERHEHCVGFALTRPPHHHSCNGRLLGFCLANGVAIAAKMLVRKYGYRVIIVDWDVHFGEGTATAVREEKHIQYISLHRRAKGSFFPGKYVIGDRGYETDVGSGEGFGNTINCAFEMLCGDTDYLLAFHNVVLPAMTEFHAEIPGCQKTFVLVSAGFDAADWEYFDVYVTKDGFGTMAALLRRWCLEHNAPMCLALEGGYTSSLAYCVESTMRAVRGEPPTGVRKGTRSPLPSTDMMLQKVHSAHKGRWKWANCRIPPYGSKPPILKF